MAATMHEDRPTPAIPEGNMRTHATMPETPSNGQSLSMDVDARTGLQTPTRDSLPTPAVQAANEGNTQTSPKKEARQRTDSIGRTDSLRSNRSHESGDVDMDEDEDGSDNESVVSENGRPSKKKKGQRFFCTEFPPCTLSFTRSEHLARHIRKHTGERPFQCHCLRRFSRLDNLRQHAQTVHVNEEIPGDSLAATGTRFQRQIRTDRMRTPGHRARASTISSGTGVHSRGHSRNYSGSSIGSISDLGSPDDGRRRPQPLAMAQTPTRGGLMVDPYTPNSGGPDHNYTYYSQSPSTFNSPPLYSREIGSPGSIGHPMQSPLAMTPRALTWGERPNRRLSVPSSSPMMQPGAPPYKFGSGYMSPVASSHTSTYSNGSSMVQSPTSSVFSHDRRESATELDIRRRTWHPSTLSYTSRPATSGLSYYQTPDAAQPSVAAQPAAAQSVRLPGIDSFDRATEQPDAPPRRALSPMEVDAPPRQGTNSSTANGGFGNALGISAHGGSQKEGQYDSPQSRPASYGGEWQHISNNRPVTAPHPQDQASRALPPPPVPASSNAPVGSLSEAPFTPRQKKRHGWYNGPLTGSQDQSIYPPHRTSPEGSSSSDGLPTPSNSAADYQPAIIHSNGEIEPPHHGVALDEHQKTNNVPEPSRHFRNHVSPARPSSDMYRLDALVAVATSENRAVENR